MTSELPPQPGDTVRVTGTVTQDGAYPGKMALENKNSVCDWTVEIVKRADDPSQDLVGTVAELDGVVVPIVKVDKDTWVGVGGGVTRRDKDMQGRTVIGAVPATPAAHTQTEAAGLPSRPLVLNYGDDEPDKARTFADVSGNVISCPNLRHWKASDSPGHYQWHQLQRDRFPLIEVLDPWCPHCDYPGQYHAGRPPTKVVN